MVEEDFLEEEEDVEGDISKARGEKEKETFVLAYVACPAASSKRDLGLRGRQCRRMGPAKA